MRGWLKWHDHPFNNCPGMSQRFMWSWWWLFVHSNQQRRCFVTFHGHTNLSIYKKQHRTLPHRTVQQSQPVLRPEVVVATSNKSAVVVAAAAAAAESQNDSVNVASTGMTSQQNATRTSIEMNPPLLRSSHRFSPNMFVVTERPPNPMSILTSPKDLDHHASVLHQWLDEKQNVLCMTGAGLSTESGIPDYRGSNGSYHIGHKPMIHDHFMKSSLARQRYWGRGMVGWRFFDEKQPSMGHYAITQLESLQKLGVTLEDRPEYYADNDIDQFVSTGSSSCQQRLSTVTQNVDSLHRRAGTKHMLELHGRNDRVICMNCGHMISRAAFHDDLEHRNTEWLQTALSMTKSSDMRADGDASVIMNYENVVVPTCQQCGDGFLKPDVVFFGDSVPVHRVKLIQAAIDPTHCDGLLVVGSSLAVHSAFRHVKSAHERNIPIAILNVGHTRAEIEQLSVLKIEAPAGPTLDRVVTMFTNSNNTNNDR